MVNFPNNLDEVTLITDTESIRLKNYVENDGEFFVWFYNTYMYMYTIWLVIFGLIIFREKLKESSRINFHDWAVVGHMHAHWDLVHVRKLQCSCH